MSTQAKVLTVNEPAEHLRVHPSTLYRLLNKQQLPAFKIGNDWRFNVEAIDRWRMVPFSTRHRERQLMAYIERRIVPT
jgi:excisionase family DNA binding protein